MTQRRYARLNSKEGYGRSQGYALQARGRYAPTYISHLIHTDPAKAIVMLEDLLLKYPNVMSVATHVGVHYVTVYRWLNRLGIRASRWQKKLDP
jgi:hypothetical protein